MVGRRSLRVPARLVTAGVLGVGVAVLLLLGLSAVWRAMIRATGTYGALRGVIGLASGVNDVLAGLALLCAITAAASLATLLHRSHRSHRPRLQPTAQTAPTGSTGGAGAGLGWRSVWGLAACLVGVVAALVVVLASAGRGHSLVVLGGGGGGGDTVDPAVRSAFARLYDPPPLPATLLGIALLAAAGALSIVLARRITAAAPDQPLRRR